MRNPLRKPVVEESAVPEQPTKSRFQIILEDLSIAHKRLDHAAHLFSTLIVDIEKVMNFVDKFRSDLTHAIEEAGGNVSDTTDVEAAISEFIPKNVKALEG